MTRTRRNFFIIEFVTAEGVQLSRTYANLRTARKMAAWYAERWPTRIMRGGIGGMEVVR